MNVVLFTLINRLAVLLLLAKLSPKICCIDLKSVKCPEKQSCGERTQVHKVATGAVCKVQDVSHIT